MSFVFQTGLYEFLSKLTDSKTRGLGTLALRINFSGYYTFDGIKLILI